MLFEIARNVRSRIVEEVRKAPGSGTRPHGNQPLYIMRQGEDLFFGSELKAIFVHPEIERRLSLHGLDCYLSLNYVPCPWTLVEGIEKLPPGYWLEWTDGEITSDAYWKLPFTHASNYTLDSAKEELDSLLQQSVREHMISDVPRGFGSAAE